MDLSEAIGSGFSNYVNFEGRSRRSAFWWWALFAFLISISAAMADGLLFGVRSHSYTVLRPLVSLGLFLPNLAISVRRLHDTGRSGWWYLIGFTLIGLIPLLIWYCERGTFGPNRYGGDPMTGDGRPLLFGIPGGGAAAYPTGPRAPAGGMAAQLEHLARLRTQGALTEAEFLAAKAKIMREAL